MAHTSPDTLGPCPVQAFARREARLIFDVLIGNTEYYPLPYRPEVRIGRDKIAEEADRFREFYGSILPDISFIELGTVEEGVSNAGKS
jgi:hypothetical protein